MRDNSKRGRAAGHPKKPDPPLPELPKLFELLQGEKYAGFWFSVEKGEWHGRAFFDNGGWHTFYSAGKTPEEALAALTAEVERWKNKA